MKVNLAGHIYPKMVKEKGYSPELQTCIESTVSELLDETTTFEKPGMLLGKIQSGKTRTFIGVIGLAFDNGYDIAVILTKGTKALVEQTCQRLEFEFHEFVENDVLKVFDIMHFPENLAPYELNQRLIIVVKKETNNLERLQKAFFETYPVLGKRKVLIVDDEADYASVGFKRTRDEGIEINKIANQIDSFRKSLVSASFLQVTATPYSLYLQPEEIILPSSSEIFKPIRPAFTNLVPLHKDYVGGNYYFETNQDDGSIGTYLFEEVSDEEMEVLKKEDRRIFKLEDSLISEKIRALRDGIINFMVGGIIRRLQASEKLEKAKKYSFVVHTEMSRGAHDWQEKIVEFLVQQLKECVDKDPKLLSQLVQRSYENLQSSIRLIDGFLPDFNKTLEEVSKALKDGLLMFSKVNSDADVKQLLDPVSGQLKLRTPLNIYIGGQILDRGITIGNLIGFYYGRRPKKIQQDTVLQHSRMFGFRPLEDLAVTRFYTTRGIYDAMQKINEFDSALRETIENGAADEGVVFIRKDMGGRVVPCSPNKILLSRTTTLRPYKRLLPVGFQTQPRNKIKDRIEYLDSTIENLIKDPKNKEDPFLIPLEEAEAIINVIAETFEDEFGWDVQAFIASMRYLSLSTKTDLKGRVWGLVRRDRSVSRIKESGIFFNSPDTSKREGQIAREKAIDIPVLMLFRQKGDEESGWRGAPFWWPVLMVPRNTKTVIFTSETIDQE